ncbi:patatin-like protein [Streptomyces sp. UNOB3_S3]|uniref:patatin-like protein n=1 Tax=Streptomyces sp. UNOB3_S3 TaxID=2871682 RepID=UPI001E2FFC04|nr:patatin-like protein [Streptomyces sp. UNOB3_S3]MCC3773387.1 patatin-like protein [Streptomyces sp. UNOB3_S3]
MAETDDIDRQDIRLAVVMNGGVSLAVWIGGVTVELHHLAMARRWDEAVYRPLLDLLCADARVDVIAGTSAGGLNGAFLALGLAREKDITPLCGLWRDKGALGKLLQHPLQRQPPSLLQGDYFLDELRNALRAVATSPPRTGADDGRTGRRPVELILTGTLWRGRYSSSCDDTGVRITEVDHDARFRFASQAGATDPVADLQDDGVIDRLAVAARCTSSFPAAFAPQWVDVDADAADGPWPSTAGRANFRVPQYVVDGGILLNKPIRPALEAVYRQTAQSQVRRVLTYVVPDPSEAPPQAPAPEPTGTPPLRAPDVLLGVLTRLRSTDSVSRELTEIQVRNEDARHRRRARARFAYALAGAARQLSGAAWQGYLETRIEHAADTIGRWLAAGQPAETAGRWSEREIADRLRVVLRDRRARPESFIPRGDSVDEATGRTGTDWDWGQTAVQGLRDIVVDVLRRAVWLAPMGSPERRAIIEARRRANTVFEEIEEDWRTLAEHWTRAGAGLPPGAYDGLGKATAAATRRLEDWLHQALTDWDGPPDTGAEDYAERHARRYGQATALADSLMSCDDALSRVAGAGTGAETGTEAGPGGLAGEAVVDPVGTERTHLKALTDYLLHSTQDVLDRMLRLEVVQQAYGDTQRAVEQEVELIQVSSREPGLLTGRQLHHFGAFYRASWRVNDWIHGRMDGAAHLARALMSVERLRQVWATDDDADDAAHRLVDALRACAVDARDPADRAWLEQTWQEHYASTCRGLATEQIIPIRPATPPGGPGPEDDPRLGLCVEAVTHALQTNILRQELHLLADAVRTEGDGRPEDSTRWLAQYDAAASTTTGRPLPAETMWRLWESARTIGGQRITQEAGGDLFAETAAHSAAVTASAVGAPRVKAVGAVFSALRGYTLAVWAMVRFLTRPGRFGRRAVDLAVVTGGVLLAMSLFVPGLPVAFTLAGVFLLLAGWSAAALLTRDARRLGLRLAAVVLVLLCAAAFYIYANRNDVHLRETLWSLAVKLGVGLLVVLLGIFLARTRGPRGTFYHSHRPDECSFDEQRTRSAAPR